MMKLIVLVAAFFFIKIVSTTTNSYVYLPDRYIQEEIAIGSLIVDVADELQNYMQHNHQSTTTTTTSTSMIRPDEEEEEEENVHYTFLEDTKSSTENTYFILDSITGRITSKRYLDRESMCINRHCMDTCDLGNTGNVAIINNNNNLYNTQVANSSGMRRTKQAESNGNCKMNVKILIIPLYSIVSLNVIVQDINDNKPQFSIEHIVQSVPENVPIGYKIPIELAYDPDAGANAIQYYSLTQIQAANPSSTASASSDLVRDVFELVMHSGGSDQQLALVVKRKLDREKVSQYNITIAACDGTQTCGQLKLVLNVDDINDHNPIFMRDSYVFEVAEHMQPGALIGQLGAYDMDEGVNGRVKYAIIGEDEATMVTRKYFELDADMGTLKLSAALDYESERHFSLNIEARDCGIGSLPAYTTVEIRVLDVNDNAAEISVSFLNTLFRNYSSSFSSSESENNKSNNKNVSGLSVYMNENVAANKFIAHVSISDRDSADNAKLEWKVYVNEAEMKLPTVSVSTNDSLKNVDSSSSLLKINKLNSNSFTINTNGQLDREMVATVNVSIVAWDYGLNGGFNLAYYNFTIVLVDENDNAPKFDQPQYDLEIYENNHLGQLIYVFKVMDADAGDNGRVTFSIVDNNNNNNKFVHIDAHTGALKAAQVFDREEKSQYEFYIQASDNGSSRRMSAKVKCKLSVRDINDNRPRITYNSSAVPYRHYSNRTHLMLSLDENVPAMTQLAQFRCDDPDNGAQVAFRLAKNNNNNIENYDFLVGGSDSEMDFYPFRISPDGKFYVWKKLDREQVDAYEFHVICQDQSLNSSLKLLVSINDINDNCPRTTTPANKKAKFINRNNRVVAASPLFEANYTDLDAGKNGELTFELLSHSDLAAITIHGNYQLKISLSNKTNLLKLGKYALNVKISDKGHPACIKNEHFILYIGDDKYATEQQLVEKLARKDDDDHFHFVNDQQDIANMDDDDEIDKVKLKNSKSIQLSSNNNNEKIVVNNSFSKDDYLILFCLLATLMIIIVLFCLIGFVYLCNKLLNRRKTKKSSSSSDMLKVKNYCDKSSSSSGSSTTSSSDDNQTEINNLLESAAAEANNHRLSLSLKSTDQSQSADSVVSSNVTFAKDTTTTTTTSSATNSQNNNGSIYAHHNSLRQHQQLNRYSSSNMTNKASISSNSSTFANNNNNNNSNNYDEYANLIPNSHSINSGINKLNNNTMNRNTKPPIYNESIIPQYVKINANSTFTNNYSTLNRQQQQSSGGDSGKNNLLLLSSFPQKFNNSSSTTQASILNKQQHQHTLKKQSYSSGASSTSPSSATSATSSTSDGEDCHHHSRRNIPDLVVIPADNSDTATTKSQQQYHPKTASNNRDVHIKYNSIRQYIDLTDDETSTCLYLSSANATNNNNNNSNNKSNTFLRSSAV